MTGFATCKVNPYIPLFQITLKILRQKVGGHKKVYYLCKVYHTYVCINIHSYCSIFVNNHIPVYTLQHDNKPLSRDSGLFFDTSPLKSGKTEARNTLGNPGRFTVIPCGNQSRLLPGIDTYKLNLKCEGGIGGDTGLGRTLGAVCEITGDIEDIGAAGSHQLQALAKSGNHT